ncbi:hypothetical protein GWR56_10625 [Mucilaginibacter sp. 14171R-50]|uniref:hypothetical protein n=1 Tax=Mucilaginibacter sp. 14171R-50 TaxID=2703789 RepID=UPI00138C7B6A|nr:hypothetical protein [Mucilaginibacter sp. 14171R-50]QHS55967.1 hypothetical protein GWR56_10625 [Mucilaginibacter sp. 14171R-50]
MSYEIVISRNGYKQVLQIISETFKHWNAWTVRFPDGEEAVLFKCGNLWMQRNEDDLDKQLLNAIGEKIDHINLGIALS